MKFDDMQALAQDHFTLHISTDYTGANLRKWITANTAKVLTKPGPVLVTYVLLQY